MAQDIRASRRGPSEAKFPTGPGAPRARGYTFVHELRHPRLPWKCMSGFFRQARFGHAPSSRCLCQGRKGPARAIQIIRIAGDQVEAPQPPPRQAHSTAPKFSLSQHELCYVEARAKWRCRRCNMAATTDQTLKGLRTGGSRECRPTAIQPWQANLFF
eukprot:9095984-Pyramimonas_sp.AAC.1